MLVDVGVGAAEEVGKVFDEIADADFQDDIDQGCGLFVIGGVGLFLGLDLKATKSLDGENLRGYLQDQKIDAQQVSGQLDPRKK